MIVSFVVEIFLGGRRGAGVELMVMHLLTITSDGVASGIVRYAGNGAVGRSHGRIVALGRGTPSWRWCGKFFQEICSQR